MLDLVSSHAGTLTTPGTRIPCLLCAMWQVLVPAMAASLASASSSEGFGPGFPPLGPEAAATVPIHPAYLHSLSITHHCIITRLCRTHASITPLPTAVPSTRPNSSAATLLSPFPTG